MAHGGPQSAVPGASGARAGYPQDVPDLRPLTLSLSLFLVACGPKWVENEVDGFRRLTATLKAGADGQRPLRLEPLADETSMLLTAVAETGQRTHVVEVEADGGIVFEAVEEAKSDRSTTNAGYLSSAVTLNWPRSGAETLEPLKVTVGNVSEKNLYVQGTLNVSVLFASDGDLTQGVVPVVIVYAGGTDDDPDLVDAVTEAVGHWRTIYADIGLQLDVAESSWPNGDLGVPVDGDDPDWAALAEQVGPRTLNVVIAPSITGVDDVLGIAGDIPGPMTATNRSGVLVSALDSAGTDGVFSDLEVQLLGETMAHEVGHYLGLYHPVETTWDRWDALDDTEECGGENRCISLLSDLLMFPFPVCGFMGCTSQALITEDQAAVMHRYTGLR